MVAENKGNLNILRLNVNDIEKAKIKCATEHFKKISNGDVKYYAVGSYEQLMEEVMKVK